MLKLPGKVRRKRHPAIKKKILKQRLIKVPGHSKLNRPGKKPSRRISSHFIKLRRMPIISYTEK